MNGDAREILKSIGYCKVELRKMSNEECEKELIEIYKEE